MKAKFHLAILAALLIAGLAPQAQAFPGPTCTEIQGRSCQARQTTSCWAQRNGQWVIGQCYCGTSGLVCSLPKGSTTPIPRQAAAPSLDGEAPLGGGGTPSR